MELTPALSEQEELEAAETIALPDDPNVESFYASDEEQPSAFYSEKIKTNPVTDNAEAIAAQAAYVESLLSGEPIEETFVRNLQILQHVSPNELQDRVKKDLNRAYSEDAEAALSDALAMGNAADAAETLKYLSDEPAGTFEDDFVSLVADENSSEEAQFRAAKANFAYNRISQLIGVLKEEVTNLDVVASFTNQIAPGRAAAVLNEALERVIGETIDWSRVSDIDVINAFRNKLLTLPIPEQELLLQELVAAAKHESGTFTDNMQEVINVLREIQTATGNSAAVANVLAGADAAAFIPTAPLVAARKLAVGTVQLGVAARTKGGLTPTLNSVGNTELAGKAIASDIVNGTNVAGLPKGEAVARALSIGENPLTLAGQPAAEASEAVRRGLSEFAASVRAQEILSTTGHTGLSKEDVAAIAKFKAEEYAGVDNPAFKAFRTLDQDDLGFSYEVVYKHPKSPTGFRNRHSAEKWAKREGIEEFRVERIPGKHRDYFTVNVPNRHIFTAADATAIRTDDTGKLTNLLFDWLAFPAQTLNFNRIATSAINVHKEATLRNNFRILYKEAWKGLRGDRKKAVTEALVKGDKDGVVYDSSKLHDMGLDEAQQLAYYKVRSIRDISFVRHDKSIVDNLRFRGFSKVTIKGTDDFPEFETAGKMHTLEDAKKLYRSGDITALDIHTGKVINLTSDTVENIYRNGNVITRIDHPHDMNGISHDVLITRADDITSSPLITALPYRPGEFARQYAHDWFIYRPKSGYKNGKKTTFNETIHTSPTHRDATRWVTAHNQALKIIREGTEAGTDENIIRTQVDEVLAEWGDGDAIVDGVKNKQIDPTQEYGTKFDKEVPAGTKNSEQIEAMYSLGRLFTGKRGEHLTDIYGEAAPTKSIAESLAHEMSFVSKFTSLSTWRETQIEQILKTFGDRLEDAPSRYEKALMAVPKGSMDAKDRQYLKRLRHHVETRIGIPTEGALRSKERLINFSKVLEDKGFDKASTLIRGFKDTTPAQAIRTATFHRYLGLFNLQQLIVQANGAAIAASLHPIHGLKAGLSYSAIRMGVQFDTVGNTNALKAMAKSMDLATMGFKSGEDFLETVQLVRKTGILNDIKSSALYYVKEGAVDLESDSLMYASNIYTGARNALKGVGAAGLKPFQYGEETARIIALDIARREWKKLNPGKSPLSRGAMNEIVTLQDKYTLGMTKGNMGQMQQGWFAIPLQFAQWNFKFAESLLGKTFTITEKLKIIGGASFLYGAEGTAGYLGLDWVLGEILGEDVRNRMTDDEKLAYTQGATAYLIKAATGAEVIFGERVGPSSFFTDMWKSFGENGNALEIITGAPGSFLFQEAEAISDAFRILFQSEDTFTFADVIESADVLAKASASSYSNMTKYYMAYKTDGYLRTKLGRKIAPATTTEMVFGIFGLHPDKSLQSLKWAESKRSVDVLISDLSKDYERMFRQYYAALDKGDKEEAMRIWGHVRVRRNTIEQGDGKAIAYQAWNNAVRNSRKHLSIWEQQRKAMNKPIYDKVERPRRSYEQEAVQ